MMEKALFMLRHIKKTLALRQKLISSCEHIGKWKRFWKSYKRFKQLAPPERQPLMEYLYPCLEDDTAVTSIDPIYFYQDSWAFEKIVNKHPARHVDVGSHHKFVALLSKVVPVTMVDIRPLSLSMNTINFKQGSILDLPYEDGTAESLSSLCVVEHIGLGRYGDPLDPYGSEKAIQDLKRIVRPGGDLYLSLPLDDENRIYFNAHRAFKEEYVLQLFEPFQIVERHYIYGRNFGDQRKPGFGTGCYHLKCPL